MKKQVAIVAFSFGLRKNDPGESNRFLANVIDKFWKKPGNWDVLVISQWEIAECLKFQNPACVIKTNRNPKKYLDSEELAAQAIKFLNKVTGSVNYKIFVVAHPFLHRIKCIKLFPGFEVEALKTGWVPFDKESIQWWTRGPVRLLIYAVLQKLFGYKGPPEKLLLSEKKSFLDYIFSERVVRPTIWGLFTGLSITLGGIIGGGSLIQLLFLFCAGFFFAGATFSLLIERFIKKTGA